MSFDKNSKAESGAGSQESGAHTTLTTRSGLAFSVRAAAMTDEQLLAAFFKRVEPEDLRFRFLSGLKTVDHDRLAMMLQTDRDQPRSFLAFDTATGTLAAMATLVGDASGERAEVAISVAREYKHRGIGWTFLKYIAEVARTRGFKTLESMESRESHEAIELEREMGFTVRTYPDDPSLIILSMGLTWT